MRESTGKVTEPALPTAVQEAVRRGFIGLAVVEADKDLQIDKRLPGAEHLASERVLDEGQSQGAANAALAQGFDELVLLEPDLLFHPVLVLEHPLKSTRGTLPVALAPWTNSWYRRSNCRHAGR